MTTRTQDLAFNAADSATELTDAELKAKAAEITRKHTESADDPGKALLTLGGIALGGLLLKSLLSSPVKRFRPTVAATASEMGEAIRLRRLDLGLTQKELAARSGTGDRFVLEVEQGKETAEIGKVLDLLDALDLETRIVPRS